MSELLDSNYSLEKLARDVLLLSRDTLLVNLRFLDTALNQFEYVCAGTSSFCTDGKRLFYSARWLLEHYKQEQTSTNRYYLHMVLHCIFRHMYGVPYEHRKYWDMACDIAVEAAISNLNIKALNVEREGQQKKILKKMMPQVGILTAEKIYRYLMDTHDDGELASLQQLFSADDHSIWYYHENTKNSAALTLTGAADFGTGQKVGIDNGSSSMVLDDVDSITKGSSSYPQKQFAQAEVWREIASRLQVDLETFCKGMGDAGGNLIQNLYAVNREKYDYESFLKKFAVFGETMQINDDEFDYIFYTYGLKLYHRMPLIEPLEYKEVKRIKEFVVAIDTSGSVSGQMVQAFMQKTYNIIKSEESFFIKINLHIIQCDAEIQEHVKITSQLEFDRYLSNITIRGLGGTDFRPVFQEVDRLIREHEFSNLKGLIYLTDGYGDFPEAKPDYATAFVFVKEDYEVPEVPPWAIKLVIRPEEV